MVHLKLYGMDVSPPVRACHLTLKALQLPYEFEYIDLFAGEHMTPEYLAKNPQHTVPTLEDSGNFIWDSHAIMPYLMNKYAKDDSLYPKDPLKRAVVDQRLHYDSGVVYRTLYDIMVPVYFENQTVVPRKRIDQIIAVYDLVEVFLQDYDYIAGDQLTIADFSVVATVTSLALIWPIDAAKYVKTSAWIKRLEALPYYAEGNTKGLIEYKEVMKARNLTTDY